MHSYAAIISVLAAAGAIAAPLTVRDSHGAEQTDIKVILSRGRFQGPEVTFGDENLSRVSLKQKFAKKYDTVALEVGPQFANQAIRCQVLDARGQPVTVNRGENRDVTFADGGNGPWTFDAATKISKITCDEEFVKGGAAEEEEEEEEAEEGEMDNGQGNDDDNQQGGGGNAPTITIRAQNNEGVGIGFSDASGGEARQLQFPDVSQREELNAPGGTPAFLAMALGDQVSDDFRCELRDAQGETITVRRGGNDRQSFAAGEPWEILDFENVDIATVVCDPSISV